MARRAGVIVSLILIVGLLAGCGLRMFAQREAWRSQAENQCLAQKLVRASAYAEPMQAINGPGACGMDHPFAMTAFAEGSVTLRSKAVLACPAISTVDLWLADIVQPAAAAYFGASVAELKAGSYSCRSVNGQAGARASEHAYGNAVDLMGLRLADGREINIERGWHGDPAEQDFLREIFTGACGYFTTVLAPGSDAFHYNHIHMDLARRTSGRAVCKPVLKWTSPLVASNDAGRPSGRAGRDHGAPSTVADAGYAYPAPTTSRSSPQATAPAAARDTYDTRAQPGGRSVNRSTGAEIEDPLAVDEPRAVPSRRLAPPPAQTYSSYPQPPARSTPIYTAPQTGPAPMELRPPGSIGR